MLDSEKKNRKKQTETTKNVIRIDVELRNIYIYIYILILGRIEAWVVREGGAEDGIGGDLEWSPSGSTTGSGA